MAGVGRLYEKVELYFSAAGLPKLDVTSNTDPFLVLYEIGRDGRPKFIATTECIMDSQAPNWTTQFLLDYRFEETQRFQVEVFDKDDGPLTNLTLHQRCGTAVFTLGNLMCAPAQTARVSLTGGHPGGTVTVKAEVVASGIRDEFECTFAGSKLANKDGFFGKSDPFLDISRIREDGSFVHVFKNQPVMNNLSPTWPVVKLPMQQLCNGDLDRPIKIDILDWDKDGTHDPMGGVQTSVRALLESRGQPFNVIEEDQKKKKKGYVNSGTLTALNPCIRQKPGLLEYIRGGLEISLSVAIDFTGSNGDPRMPNSLHFLTGDPSRLNQYESAIVSVGSVVESYDADKQFPVMGFGCQILQPNGQYGPVQHCFPVYAGGYEVAGVGGILQAYRECLPRVHLSGPTMFAPVLNNLIQTVRSKGGCTQQQQKYNVLLILTDGQINDMQATIDALVTASSLPISVIIVGVGNADFSSMRELDDDDGDPMKNSRGERIKRDIVQFVRFNDYAGDQSGVALAADVLAEIPDQVVTYMLQNRFMPNEPPPAF